MIETRAARVKTLSMSAHMAPHLRATFGLTVFALALMLMALTVRAAPNIITAHGISTFGDLKYPADFKHLDYVNPEAPKGGEISIWGFGAFDSMNPYSTKGRAEGFSTAPYESLLAGTADETNAAYGLLAESLQYPEDRSWVIFKIRPEARFSDGSPVTAEDVVFSYNVFLNKGLPSFRAVLARSVASAEVIDPLTVKYTFTGEVPNRDLPQTVGGLPIFSKADYETNKHDLEESTLVPLIGTGPYALDQLDVGKRVVYKRNPDYWGANLPINIGRNNFDSIRIEYYADYNAAFEGFKAGNYTFRNEASSKIWATGYDFPAVHKGWVKKAELHNGSLATSQSFIFNLRQPQFQDPLVREAIGLMFNFEWSNAKLFFGLYARITSFWENSALAAKGMPSEAELALLRPLAAVLPPGVLDQPAVMPPTSSSTRQLDRKNLRRASKLLDQAGWLVGDDGIRRNASGETLRIEFLNDSQSFDRVINPYVENLRQLGLDTKLTRVDSAQMTNRERSYDFDVITDQLPMDYVPGNGLKQYFGSETADTSVFNKMGLKNEAVDKLIDVVMAAKTSEELTTSVRALDRVLRALHFWVPQWFKDKHTVAYYDMFEHPDPLPPYALGQLDFWWYNADKAEKLKAAGAF